MTGTDRDALIVSHLDLARVAASVALRRGLPRSVDRDDLEGAAFLALCTAADRYVPGTATFKTFAWPSVLGGVLDHLRRGYRQSRPLTFHPWPHETHLPDPICGPHIRAAVVALPPREFFAVWLVYWHGVKKRTIAKAFGVHETKIAHLLTRAYRRMRVALEVRP